MLTQIISESFKTFRGMIYISSLMIFAPCDDELFPVEGMRTVIVIWLGQIITQCLRIVAVLKLACHDITAIGCISEVHDISARRDMGSINKMIADEVPHCRIGNQSVVHLFYRGDTTGFNIRAPGIYEFL
ncbi:hypothetical protein SDC9_184670 [bioreactor metagenome]|uniref:Uncharacterized protein n=1 Tax=bioreactor metagenome TaxID=1076179 RepID=A0A645HM21_9ZZZZ